MKSPFFRQRLAVGVPLLLVPLAAIAETQTTTLSSQQLVEQVLSANAALKADFSEVKAARQRSSYASDFDDPSITYISAPQTIGSSIGSRHIVQLTQVLPSLGTLRDRGQIADSEVALAQGDADDRRARLVAKSRVAWTEWWYLHRALQINADNQRVLQQIIAATEARYGAGSGLQQDVLQAQTRYERVRLEAVRLKQKRRQARARINALRGEKPWVEVRAPAALPDWKPLPKIQAIDKQLIQADPRFRQLQAMARGAEAKHALAKKASIPDVKVSLGYLGTLDPDEKRLQVGLSVSLPLNRSRLRAAADAAAAERDAVVYELVDAEARITAELDQALIRAEEATAASVIYRQSLLPKARQTLAAARADYESTVGDFGNVIRAEILLLNLKLELARTRADWRIAVATVERITNAGLWSAVAAPAAVDSTSGAFQ